jgi:hypothetical protein
MSFGCNFGDGHVDEKIGIRKTSNRLESRMLGNLHVLFGMGRFC